MLNSGFMKTIVSVIFYLSSNLLIGQNLTGIWTCDDGGTYYIKQNSNDLWWYGDGGTNWRNVFRGKIHGNTIFGEWSDVPSGIQRNSGALTIEITNSNKLTTSWTSGNFGGKIWTRGNSKTQPNKYNSPAGTWQSTYGDITFNIQGNRIVGTYQYHDGKIEGTLTGNVLKGTWQQDNGHGEISITFNKDFTDFSTVYLWNGKTFTEWTGNRD